MKKSVKLLVATGTIYLGAYAAVFAEGVFTMQPYGDEGFVVLDKENGKVSVCEKVSGELICRATADERSALLEEIERLRDEVANLETGSGRSALSKDDRLEGLPSEQELDEFMGFAENFFKKFIDMVNGLDFEKKDQPQT